MREFDYDHRGNKLLTPEIVKYLNFIHEEKGKQDLFIEQSPDTLSRLIDVAIIQSTESSNRIEGIYTSDKRLKELVQEKVKPKNRSEEEILGYKGVLATIHESYDYIPISVNVILQLHRDLYNYSSKGIGGSFKISDNQIIEKDINGVERVRFTPVPASQTLEHMNRLCDSFNKAINEDKYDPLILIPLFILDFLCIHPFSDGNGRMSRLLTLLLLYKSGYIVGKYISIEMLIEKTKFEYYDTLEYSSHEWHQEKNNDEPFIKYFLGVTKIAYIEFEDRVEYIKTKAASKFERVKLIIDNHIGKISKSEIMNLAPDISKITIERSLASLLKDGEILKVGSGKNTAYVKK